MLINFAKTVKLFVIQYIKRRKYCYVLLSCHCGCCSHVPHNTHKYTSTVISSFTLSGLIGLLSDTMTVMM